MEDLLANMAVYHGRMWESTQLDGLEVPSERLRSLESFSYRERTMVGIDRTRAVTPPALQDRGEEVYSALGQVMSLASAGPRTLLHGDAHIGNTYRTSEGRMGITDWQGMMQGRWVYDVSYVIGSGLAVEDRRAWDRDLLAFYLERLAQAGGEAPEFDAAWLEYRQLLIYPYITWAFTIGRGPLQPRMQPDEISREIVKRMANAIVDHDSLGAVPGRPGV
jgi:hypothetical protein